MFGLFNRTQFATSPLLQLEKVVETREDNTK